MLRNISHYLVNGRQGIVKDFIHQSDPRVAAAIVEASKYQTRDKQNVDLCKKWFCANPQASLPLVQFEGTVVQLLYSLQHAQALILQVLSCQLNSQWNRNTEVLH